MFFHLLTKSLARRRSRKLVAVVAVWIGTSLVVGLLTLSLDVGDKMNRELRSFGANIQLAPAAAAIAVRVGGYELAPAVDSAYLDEAKLGALQAIFWANNILEVAPRLVARGQAEGRAVELLGIALRQRPPHWLVTGAWPAGPAECLAGTDLARRLGWAPGRDIVVAGPTNAATLRLAGVIASGGAEDAALIAALPVVQRLTGLPGKISVADISALTTPENRLAEKFRQDPKALTPAEYERWSCTPFPGSVAAQIQGAVPGAVAQVVRRVSESQGAVLTRIQGLVTVLGLLAAVASSLSVMGVLTSAVLERRTEVALLQAIGAKGSDVLALFLTEAGALGVLGGLLAAGTGALVGRWLVHAVFGGVAEPHGALLLLAPVLGLLTALAASALPIAHTLRQETAPVLHGN